MLDEKQFADVQEMFGLETAPDHCGHLVYATRYHHAMPNGSLSLAEYPAAKVRLTC